MPKFLLGLVVAAVLLQLSQNAQAHPFYYHHYYGDHHAYMHQTTGIMVIGMAGTGTRVTPTLGTVTVVVAPN